MCVGKFENHWFTAGVSKLFYVKAQIVNISGFWGLMSSVMATELGHCGTRAQVICT